MKKFKTKICRILIATLVVLSMCTINVFAASTAKATSQVKFRTAVINKLNIPAGASAQVVRGNETLDAFEGMRLNSGDTVRTVGDATLYILVDQNKIIRLAKDTEVVLENTFLGTRVKMKLVKGSMFFNVVEKLPEDESLQFVYGNITISVRGTSAVLSGVDGAFGMLLTDGIVQATETLPNGEEVSAPIEAGTKFEYAAGDPEKGTQSVMKTSSFTLSELPPDVVEEMKNDENLKARIVENVPVSTGPSGPVYTTPDKVDLETDCNKGENTMEPSEEIEKKAQETRGEAVEEPASSDDDEDDDSDSWPATHIADNTNAEANSGATGGTAGHGDGNGDDDDDGDDGNEIISVVIPGTGDPETAFTCPLCQFAFASEEAHTLECGHYACVEGNHYLLDCGMHYFCEGVEGDHETELPCGHYACDGKDHQTPLPCGHLSCAEGDHSEADCGHYVCDGLDHSLQDCGHYACEEGDHTAYPCGGHYHCTDTGSHEELNCGHYACESGDHRMADCGTHYYCGLDEDEYREHTYIGSTGETCCQNSGKWVYCEGCRQYILKTVYNQGGHGLAACGTHYICADGYQEAGHRLADCGTHYKCDTEHEDHTQMSCGDFHCNDEPEWFHASYTDAGCGHFACKCFRNWRAHIAINKLEANNSYSKKYMCQVGTGDSVFCPLCGEVVLASEILSGVEHMHYDGVNHCITCSGTAQSASAFTDLFRGMFLNTDTEREAKVSYILQYLKLDLTGSPGPS